MFLNMLDTLVGAGAYATLSPRRAHLLPKIDPLYTHHVLSATQFDALKRAKPSLCLNNRRPFWVNNGSDHFGVLGLRVAAASCHSGKQEPTSKRSVTQQVAILPVTGAIGPV